MAEILKGAPVASSITEKLIQRREALAKRGVTPTLAILRVGDKPDDLSFEASATHRCEKVGIAVKKIVLSENAGEGEILGAIEHVNENRGYHGLLMFRPLENKEAERKAISLLRPEKDVDCMTPVSNSKVFLGDPDVHPPCTAQAVLEILDYYGIDLRGRNVVVVGRSMVIGKPLAMLLQSKDATVTMCHSKTRHLEEICKRAEIIVSAAGSANLISRDHVSPGQVLIDVGVNVDATGKLCGDIDLEAVEPIVEAITPVPGGVGAVTTSVLTEHTISAAEKLSAV